MATLGLLPPRLAQVLAPEQPRLHAGRRSASTPESLPCLAPVARLHKIIIKFKFLEIIRYIIYNL